MMSLMFHPISLDLIQIVVIVLVLGFTPSNSIIRPAVVPLLLAVPYYVIPQSSQRLPHTLWSGIVGSQSAISVNQYIEVALLSRWTFEAHGPTYVDPNLRLANKTSIQKITVDAKSQASSARILWQRATFGISALFDSRGNNTPYEVKGVPPFSSKRPSHLPSRQEFLRKELIKFCCCYLALDILTTGGDPGTNSQLYSLRFIPLLSRLGEVTLDQLIVRIFTTVALWISLYCMMQLMYSTIAMLAVASSIAETASWRPLFGSVSEAYTLRGFWRCVFTLLLILP